MADYERRLLARARDLADTEEIAGTVTGILSGARRAGLDPAALGGLGGAATALGAAGTEIYAAGRAGPAYPDETAFTADLTDAEDEIAARLRAAIGLGDTAMAAFDAALDAVDAARAMPVTDECDGCHDRRDAAIAAAKERASLCEAVINALVPLAQQLRHALARIRAVPSNLGETYESVYNLQRHGGRMPHRGRWIEGASA
jgi:hypothetical protein